VRASVLVALVAAAAVPAHTAGAQKPKPKPDPRPNVVVISTDDQTVESLRVMSNVQRLLVQEGTTFANSFATFPLCCPSRATFLTGQYSHNHGVVGNNQRNGLRNLNERNTLPVWLTHAGYSTIFVGKYFNGYGKLRKTTVSPGWDEWHAGVTLAYFDHRMNHNGKIVRYRRAYQTDVYARTAVAAINRQAPRARPFFLWLSFFAPHHGGPREAHDPARLQTPVAAPRHRGAFAFEPLPPSPARNEADVADKPFSISLRPRLSARAIADMQAAYAQRLESLLAVDEAVAAVVEALRAQGVLNRTLIVFTSDNGYLHGEHRIKEGKEHLYEPSVRVPLVVRGPGVPQGETRDELVANIDLAPTVLDIARARSGRVLDGRSLLPLLAYTTFEFRRDLLFERGPGPSGVGDRLVTAIRTPRYVYFEHVTGERELYDLTVDPHQLESLHDHPTHAQTVAKLAARLAVLRDCAGATCRGPALLRR
jgi:arylsulfatase A-like enzyme